MAKKAVLQEPNTKKHQIAYKIIKDLIVNSKLKPNTLLVERQLCLSIGVSRTPLREALRKLASEGFVEIIPEKGAFISKIRFEDMIEIFELREALEKMAVRLFTIRKNDEMLKKLEECFAAQESAFIEKKDNSVSMKMDMEFHQIYIRGSKNSRLENFSKTILDQIDRLAISVADDSELMKVVIEQHRKILEAIKQNDANLAEKFVAEHINKVKEYHISKYYLL